jgi:hypothetical protein
MTPIDWSAIFEHADRNPPLSADLREAVSASVCSALDPDEQQAIREAGGPDPDLWVFPARLLPASYLEFLCWSNGGFFVNGDRELGMLSAEELREYLLTYEVPYYLPGTVPFALDGNGNFYLFDLRNPPDVDGEYPILFTSTENLSFDVARIVGQSFPEVCRGRTNPAESDPIG